MDPKFITVRNWAKYQGKIGNKGDARRPYIKTSTSLDSDPDFSRLTMIQRYVLEACRRLIGLHGQNLPNDPMILVRNMSVRPEERHSATRAIGKLVESGLLLLTNDKDPFSENPYDTIRNETISYAASATSGQQVETSISGAFNVED